MNNNKDDFVITEDISGTVSISSTPNTGSTATNTEPVQVYTPPGGAGTPEGSLAAEGSLAGGQGAVGSAAEEQREACPNVVYTDVVIVGAGMAGLGAAARLQEEDPTLQYVVLESTNRVGGRVKSKDIGVPENRVKIEEAANWIYGDHKGNPVLDWMDEASFLATSNDFTNVVTYGMDGQPADEEFQAEEELFQKVIEDTYKPADEQWDTDHASFPDQGVNALFAADGWTIPNDNTGNLRHTIKWGWVDWEYADPDTSIRYWPEMPYDGLFTHDERGYEYLVQLYGQNNVDQDNIVLGTRVMSMDYNQNVRSPNFGGPTYKARVNTHNGVQCTDYMAQRVISTVSPGVLYNDLIEFSPPLKYAPQTTNPMKMAQYVKIFYQFEEQFWDDGEFIVVVPKEVSQRGKCQQWYNGNFFQPGSNYLRCELMTEAFEDLIQGQRRLTDEQFDSLLEPLRRVYGDNVTAPIDIYMTELHADSNVGFGAYSNWQIGYTFNQYAQFYGGVEELTPYCDHNGCNELQEWVLHLSGSASCYDSSETVQGALYSGQRSANYVLRELGYDVDGAGGICDQHWVWLK